MTLPHFDDLDSPWSWVVMTASFLAMFVIGGTNFSIGLVHNLLLVKFGESQANTAVVGALHTSISNLLAPLSSLIVDKVSVRASVILGGVLYTVGYIVTAYANSLWLSALSCGVIAGLGGAVSWTSSMVIPNFYFRKYRNIAQGFALSGVGAGMFGIPPIVSIMQAKYGSMGFFMCLACISMHLIVFGTIMRPSKLELYAHRKRIEEQQNKKHSGVISRYYKIFTTSTVLCLSFAMFMVCSAMYTVFIYLPNYLIQKGSTEATASFVLSVCGIANIFGRFSIGILANIRSINENYLFCCTQAILCVSIFMFPLYSGFKSGQLAFGVLLGLCSGSPFVLLSPINLRFLDVERLTAALGLELCMCGAGGMVGPMIAGVLMDRGGTFDHMFVFTGSCAAVSCVLVMIPVVLNRRRCKRPPVLHAKTDLEISVDDMQHSGLLDNVNNEE